VVPNAGAVAVEEHRPHRVGDVVEGLLVDVGEPGVAVQTLQHLHRPRAAAIHVWRLYEAGISPAKIRPIVPMVWSIAAWEGLPEAMPPSVCDAAGAGLKKKQKTNWLLDLDMGKWELGLKYKKMLNIQKWEELIKKNVFFSLKYCHNHANSKHSIYFLTLKDKPQIYGLPCVIINSLHFLQKKILKFMNTNRCLACPVHWFVFPFNSNFQSRKQKIPGTSLGKLHL
jgi:hypothetical protein